MLRLPLEAPCQQAKDWYFEIQDNVKKYRGNQRITLPVKLHNVVLLKETLKMIWKLNSLKLGTI